MCRGTMWCRLGWLEGGCSLPSSRGYGAGCCLALDPDFRQDDGGWGWRLSLLVILGLTQDPGLWGGAAWLWILTFVRMTGVGDGGAPFSSSWA